MKPVQGKEYTFAEVCKLSVLDAPHLGLWLTFDHPTRGNFDVDATIQDSHMSYKEMLSVPGMAESVWRYIRTTDEWIPIFRFVGTNPEKLIDVQLDSDFGNRWCDGEPKLWVTLKGFKREQYNNIVREDGVLYINDSFNTTRAAASAEFVEMYNAIEKKFGTY